MRRLQAEEAGRRLEDSFEVDLEGSETDDNEMLFLASAPIESPQAGDKFTSTRATRNISRERLGE